MCTSYRKRGRGLVKEEVEEFPDQGGAGQENGYGQTAPIVIDYAHGHTAVTVKEQPIDMEVEDPEEEEGKSVLIQPMFCTVTVHSKGVIY